MRNVWEFNFNELTMFFSNPQKAYDMYKRLYTNGIHKKYSYLNFLSKMRDEVVFIHETELGNFYVQKRIVY